MQGISTNPKIVNLTNPRGYSQVKILIFRLVVGRRVEEIEI